MKVKIELTMYAVIDEDEIDRAEEMLKSRESAEEFVMNNYLEDLESVVGKECQVAEYTTSHESTWTKYGKAN